MNELMTIQNVRVYLGDDGLAYLNIEDVARGLGFTETAASGNETIRWRTVYKYLLDIGFIATSCDGYSTSADRGFIPENVFYRLAMKAKNETAERFQAKVADEILPSIRKHGAYMTSEVIERTLMDPDYLIRLATKLKAEREARLIAEHKVKELQPKAAFFDTVTNSKDCVDMALAAKVLNFHKGRNTLFKILREHKILDRRNLPYQEFCDRGYFRVIESTYTKPSGEVCTYFKTVVFQRGLDFLRRFLVRNGYMKEVAQ